MRDSQVQELIIAAKAVVNDDGIASAILEEKIKAVEETLKDSATITSVSREDIIQSFEGYDNFEKAKERVSQMDRFELEYLASKLSDDYCNQLFWDSVRIIFEDRFMKEEK